MITHVMDETIDVTGFDPQGPTRGYPLVTAALAYDDPVTGEVFILNVHQAISIPGLNHNLLSPMQLRLNQVAVNDVPKFLTDNPSKDTHCILIPDDEQCQRIPLQLHRVNSYFTTRKPTMHEYETCHHLYLTAETPRYDPTSDTFGQQEAAMSDSRGEVKERPASESRHLLALTTTQTRPDLTPEVLARRWRITPPMAAKILDTTTQRMTRSTLHPTLFRRFPTNDRHLRYRRLAFDLYTDTMFSSETSRTGNKAAQIFASGTGWVRAYPIKQESQAKEALALLFQREGVPAVMIMDGALTQTKGEFRQLCVKSGCQVKQTEPRSPWQNTAESAIRELKRTTRSTLARTRAPLKLWDDCLEYQARVRSLTALGIYALRGQTPETMMNGETPDISVWARTAWFQWVKFYEQIAAFPESKEVLGRDLGPAIDIGPMTTRKVIKANGMILYRSTVRHLTPEEREDPDCAKEREEFMQELKGKLGAGLAEHEVKTQDVSEAFFPGDMDLDGSESDDSSEDCEVESADHYVGCQVLIPHMDTLQQGTVQRRAVNNDGNLIGKANREPRLDTRLYEVMFPDGSTKEIVANLIAENMTATVDQEGHSQQLLDAIVDHRKTQNAVPKSEGLRKDGQPKTTTRGWRFTVQWKNGTTDTVTMPDLMASHSLELAHYARQNDLQDEPAFKWWVGDALKGAERLIAALHMAALNKRYHRITHKFGIPLPKHVKEAIALDNATKTTLWHQAIQRELTNIQVAFKILPDGKDPPPGHQFVKCHFVFDIKVEGLKRKARLVAGGHMTEPPEGLTYASVVARDTVRIALTLAALNALEVKTADIQNAYLSAPTSERIWTKLGPEFGPNEGKTAIVKRALYGLKSAGADFRSHLADCMNHMGWKPCLADPDLWYRPCQRPDDNFEYQAYVLLYVDDVLVIHHDPQSVLDKLGHYFQLKPHPTYDPDYYLGVKLRDTVLTTGVHAWGLSSSKYVQTIVENVETELARCNQKLPKRATAPFSPRYRPEADTSSLLSREQMQRYQSHVGILRWCVELGRIDIITETSMLAAHMAAPREGHMEAIYHVYAYLKVKHNARLILDPSYPEIRQEAFPRPDWGNLYGKPEEAIPHEKPQARGKPIVLRMYVDSDHAGDTLTRRSRTGYIIYLNNAPIIWHSKRQSTIETSVFGAEFVAMKQGLEATRGLRYKLRMMGVPFDDPTYIFGDNMSVIYNTQRPESVLRKKHNAICYHAIRESVAMNESITTHVRSEDNPADLCTKIHHGGRLRSALVRMILHDIED